MSLKPFEDIRALMAELPAPAAVAPAAGLGALGPIADWIAAWRGRPEVNRPILALYAGAHQGADGEDDPRIQLEAIADGSAAVARAAQHLGAGLDVFDLAVDRPVPDIAVEAAMRERECAATMAFGMEVLAKQPDLLILAGFGPGAETAAQALLLALGGEAATSERAKTAAGRGAVQAGRDPLELLRQLGGRETAALSGAILAARTQRTPVLLGGTPALAAAAVLAALDPAAIAHCRLAIPQAGASTIGLAAVTDGSLGLDDGTGALAALGRIKLACALAI